MKRFFKSILTNVLILVLMVVVVIVSLIYIPKDCKIWKEKIAKTSPEEYSVISNERKSILEDFDSFILDSATDNSKNMVQLAYSKPFKLNWYIQRDILEEVEEEISDNELKIWYVYNMGIVAKTEDKVVCFDLSTVIPTPNLLKLSDICDYLVLSHGDGDHFSPLVVRRVLENNGKVIIQDESGIWENTIKALVTEDLYSNIFNLENEKDYTVGDISVYSLRTKHRGEEKDNTWFSVKVDDFNIVHTGDGTLNDSKDWEKFGGIDLLLANTIVQPIDLRDSKARYIVPLHLHELGHNREFLEENSFTGYFKKLDNYDGNMSSEIYPLLWGESLTISN